MVSWEETRLGRLRGDLSYARRRALKVLKVAWQSRLEHKLHVTGV